MDEEHEPIIPFHLWVKGCLGHHVIFPSRYDAEIMTRVKISTLNMPTHK